MAIKYYCDGCDREVPYDLVITLDASVKPEGNQHLGLARGGTYELCKPCADRLANDMNPRSWPRIQLAAASGKG